MIGWLRKSRAALAWLAISCAVSTSATSPPVQAWLKASWDEPPLVVQILETIALERPVAFFDAVSLLARSDVLNQTEAPGRQYEQALSSLRSSGLLAAPGEIAALELSLAAREASPATQAIISLHASAVASTPPPAACADASWLSNGARSGCAVEDVLDASSTVARLYPFDHVLGAEPSAQVIVLYGDVGADGFAALHEQLVGLARSARIRYALRWRPTARMSGKPHYLAGYGTGLDIKKADYLAIDDRPIDAASDDAAAPATSAASDGSEATELVPLKASELIDIGVRATQHILGSDDPLNALVRLSQDFPRHASPLVTSWQRGPLDMGIVGELRIMHSRRIQPSQSALWLNGLLVPDRDVSTFSLLRLLRQERGRLQSLVRAGLSISQAADVIGHSTAAAPGGGSADAVAAAAEALGTVFDASDRQEGGEAIFWWNDIETDRRYQSMPTSLSNLLRPTYPGQLPAVRRNLFNAVLVLDLSKTISVAMLAESVQGFVSRGLPVRFGLVGLIGADAADSTTVAATVGYVARQFGKIDAMKLLEQLASIPLPDVAIDALREMYEHLAEAKRAAGGLKNGSPILAWTEMLEAELAGPHVAAQRAYARRLGLASSSSSAGHLLFNGLHSIVEQDFRQPLQQLLPATIQFWQQMAYSEAITDDAVLPDFLFDLPSTHTSRNAAVFPSETSPLKVISTTDALELGEDYALTGFIYSPDQEDARPSLSIYLLADLSSVDGREHALTALSHISSSTDSRLCILDSAIAGDHSTFAALVAAARSGNLDATSAHAVLGETADAPAAPAQSDDLERALQQSQRLVAAAALSAGQPALVVNDRVIALPEDPTDFDTAAYSALERLELSARVRPAIAALNATGIDLGSLSRAEHAHLISGVGSVLGAAQAGEASGGIFDTPKVARSRDFDLIVGNLTSFTVGDEKRSWLRLRAVIDPVSETAQRWSHILQALSEVEGVSVRVQLNPHPQLRELPIKRFYRHTLVSRLAFDADGQAVSPHVRFAGLPESSLLTLAMDTPHSWVAFPSRSVHDLDNIRLSDLAPSARVKGVDAVFTLENLIVEGHARDMPSGQPPRGLQLVLSDASTYTTNSLVMANLGYFQLKANPGVWQLSIRPGRSTDVFELSSVGTEGLNSRSVAETGPDVFVTTFEGATIYPQFTRRAGMEYEELLDDRRAPTPAPAGPSVVERLKGLFSLGRSQQVLEATTAVQTARTGKTINIFTVASGLLYERMAFIMMLSVMRHTENPCKFWLISNFLSPSFKALIPHMAAAYGFEYELVTYVWPHWLRAQKEKQRIIWGYKMLFLDVLFPLELERVIFVDSDQIVRTDMKQLLELDLKGAPYAFTPMGDSRTEMEGYRFWKTGYWRDHLDGTPYHISALYVVDLDRFRAMAAGDRLRASYQSLSADAGSLANLDQDLPNNMQREIPIYSLDKSWLFCETWCASEELAEAKTIDLCNNPDTHEPKLARAKRLVPEWTTYDEEVAAVARKAQSTAEDSKVFAADASALPQARLQQTEFVEEGTGASSSAADAAPTERSGHLENEL